MSRYFRKTNAFVAKKRSSHLPIEVVDEARFEAWAKKQDDAVQAKAVDLGFCGKQAQIVVLRDDQGAAVRLVVGVSADGSYYDYAMICDVVEKKFSADVLEKTSFEFEGLEGKALAKAHVGWGWACYRFDLYKGEASGVRPVLVIPKDADEASIVSAVESVDAVRDLVNMPANDMGPAEIEGAVRALADAHDAKLSVIDDQAKLEENFPLVYTVGKASPRKPRLIDMVWGDASHPKITLIGKGVAFDTGGLDLKPSQYMRLMKKDMGGAAHVIALAKMVMDHNLPVRLRLLIPAVENAVAGEAFRPGDILKSRKGLFVENTNTDAEGRLILADALCYACEESPELVIDFATLTGSARAGLGSDIPALFSSNDSVAADIQKGSFDAEDPVWAMPLWQPYRKIIEASEGDLVNSAGMPGDLIYSALFLQSFVSDDVDWVHLDCSAWELSGKAGRPKGGADTGMRAMFSYLESRYG